MFIVRQTEVFTQWLLRLRDVNGKARIVARIGRVRQGHLGDVKYFDGIGELRVDSGPGYRVYFVKRGETVIVLLCGGDKSSQRRDIIEAKRIAETV